MTAFFEIALCLNLQEHNEVMLADPICECEMLLPDELMPVIFFLVLTPDPASDV